jgi:hypothetical protein
MISASAEVDVQKMAALLGHIKEGMREGLVLAGEHIVDLASQFAPVDEGLLKDSGESHLVGDDAIDISFGNDLPDDRAIAQEYGTVYMPPQPYLAPAIKAINIAEDMATAIRRRLI